eukprot:1232112-Rhodomonas_salina.1
MSDARKIVPRVLPTPVGSLVRSAKAYGPSEYPAATRTCQGRDGISPVFLSSCEGVLAHRTTATWRHATRKQVRCGWGGMLPGGCLSFGVRNTPPTSSTY